MRNHKALTWTISALLFVIVLSGCESLTSMWETEDDKLPKLMVWMEDTAILRPDDFPQMERILKARFPDVDFKIFLELTSKRGYNLKFKEFMTSDAKPDVIIAHVYSLPFLNRIGMLEPLFIDEYNTELPIQHIQQPYLESIQSLDSRNQILYGIPVFAEKAAMLYSPDRFLTSNWPMPTDGMSWEQFIELGRQVQQNETMYSNPHLIRYMIGQFGLRFVDPATNMADVKSDQWVQFAEVVQQLYRVPGNVDNYNRQNLFYEGNGFTVYKHVFALDGFNFGIRNLLRFNRDFELVSAPTIEPGSNLGPGTIYQAASICSCSDHKETAMKVIEYLISPDVQLAFSRNGRGPVLTDKSIMDEFGDETEGIRMKNRAAFFNYEPVPIRLDGYLNRDMVYEAEGILPRLAERSVEEVLTELESAINKLILKDATAIEEYREILRQKQSSSGFTEG